LQLRLDNLSIWLNNGLAQRVCLLNSWAAVITQDAEPLCTYDNQRIVKDNSELR
jgi:hypothetical protein